MSLIDQKLSTEEPERRQSEVARVSKDFVDVLPFVAAHLLFANGDYFST